jgi:hypothetical protein
MVLNTVKQMLTGVVAGCWQGGNVGLTGVAALQIGVGGGAKRNPPAQLSRTGGLWEGFEA